MKKINRYFALVAMSFFLLSTTACREKTTEEKIEDGIEEVADDVEEGVEEVGDEIDDATDGN